METNQLVSVLLLLVLGCGCNKKSAISDATNQRATNLSGQLDTTTNGADRKLFEGIKVDAENGDVIAEFNLGVFYHNGDGVPKDAVKCAFWMRKAAEQGFPQAQYDLGASYELGEGVPKDTTEAMKWYRKAADQKDAEAQFVIGIHYATGNGVSQDEVEAAKWWGKAAEQGLAEAQFNLGHCYLQGNGVVKDSGEAVKWFRKAAEQGRPDAQEILGVFYREGEGVPRDYAEAAKWHQKAAEQGLADAQVELGKLYWSGQGVSQDHGKALEMFRRAADQGNADAQYFLGNFYAQGDGVSQDYVTAYMWLNLACAQAKPTDFIKLQGISGTSAKRFATINNATFERNESALIKTPVGEIKISCTEIEASSVQIVVEGESEPRTLELFSKASDTIFQKAVHYRATLANSMTSDQIAEADRQTHEFSPHKAASMSDERIAKFHPVASGTGFFITEDGYFITNYHVVKDAKQVRLVISAGLIIAKVIKVDAANDLALLKISKKQYTMTADEVLDATNSITRSQFEVKFAPLPIASSGIMKLGGTVATVGFPDIRLQGFAPKLAKGEIASLAGAADDPRYFQISLPVQPGNSGGALVDARGNVVGIVAAKLDASAALAATGSLPENVNYTVKSSLLLSFLESVPDVASELKVPNTKDEPFEDVVKSAQDAAVLVLVY